MALSTSRVAVAQWSHSSTALAKDAQTALSPNIVFTGSSHRAAVATGLITMSGSPINVFGCGGGLFILTFRVFSSGFGYPAMNLYVYFQFHYGVRVGNEFTAHRSEGLFERKFRLNEVPNTSVNYQEQQFVCTYPATLDDLDPVNEKLIGLTAHVMVDGEAPPGGAMRGTLDIAYIPVSP